MDQDTAHETLSEASERMIADHSDKPDASSSVSENVEGRTTQEAQAITELDKIDKFKLDGQEWTLKDLKAAILRQKDYTQKTQALAQERKALEKSREFDRNLAVDLESLRRDPKLVDQFLKIYPPEYHSIAGEYLKKYAPESLSKEVPQNLNAQPQVDVSLLSRLYQVENFMNQQTVTRHEAEIEKITNELFQKYPKAGGGLAKEAVFARAFESHAQKVELTPEVWESIIKEVSEQVEAMEKSAYADKVKKQTEANLKARDVSPGGGTAGRAPAKFSNWKDLNAHAYKGMVGSDR